MELAENMTRPYVILQKSKLIIAIVAPRMYKGKNRIFSK